MPYRTDEILRYAACREADETVMALCKECIREAEPVLEYRVCSTVLPVDRQGDFLQIGCLKTDSKTLKTAVSGCEKVLLFAATLGVGFDRLIERYSRLSPAKALMFQALGAERIESLCDTYVMRRETELSACGLHLKPRVSAGYGDLPLAIQTQIFAMLDCPRKMGLTLNASLVMSPSKSVTAFAGITPCGDDDEPLTKCLACSQKGCQYRRTEP